MPEYEHDYTKKVRHEVYRSQPKKPKPGKKAPLQQGKWIHGVDRHGNPVSDLSKHKEPRVYYGGNKTSTRTKTEPHRRVAKKPKTGAKKTKVGQHVSSPAYHEAQPKATPPTVAAWEKKRLSYGMGSASKRRKTS